VRRRLLALVKPLFTPPHGTTHPPTHTPPPHTHAPTLLPHAAIIGAQSLYLKPFNAKKRGELPHVVVMCAGRFSSHAVLEFLAQLYHPSLQLTSVTRRCVVIGEDDPDEELLRALVSPVMGYSVQYLRVSPPFSSDDLIAAAAPSAAAIFVLADSFIEMHDRGMYETGSCTPEMREKSFEITDRQALLRLIMCSTAAPTTQIFVQLSLQKSLDLVTDMFPKEQGGGSGSACLGGCVGFAALPNVRPDVRRVPSAQLRDELLKRYGEVEGTKHLTDALLKEEDMRKELQSIVDADLAALAKYVANAKTAADAPRAGPKRQQYNTVLVGRFCRQSLVQSVLVPGFSTIVSNLLCSQYPPSSFPQRDAAQTWLLDYTRGSSARLVVVPTPAAFAERPFRELAAAVRVEFRGNAALWGCFEPLPPAPWASPSGKAAAAAPAPPPPRSAAGFFPFLRDEPLRFALNPCDHLLADGQALVMHVTADISHHDLQRLVSQLAPPSNDPPLPPPGPSRLGELPFSWNQDKLFSRWFCDYNPERPCTAVPGPHNTISQMVATAEPEEVSRLHSQRSISPQLIAAAASARSSSPTPGTNPRSLLVEVLGGVGVPPLPKSGCTLKRASNCGGGAVTKVVSGARMCEQCWLVERGLGGTSREAREFSRNWGRRACTHNSGKGEDKRELPWAPQTDPFYILFFADSLDKAGAEARRKNDIATAKRVWRRLREHVLMSASRFVRMRVPHGLWSVSLDVLQREEWDASAQLISQFLLVKDMRKPGALDGHDSPLGHTIVVTSSLRTLVPLVEGLCAPHLFKTHLAHQVVVLLPPPFTDHFFALTREDRDVLVNSSVRVVEGVPTRREDLLRAGVGSAGALLLLPVCADAGGADAASLGRALAAEIAFEPPPAELYGAPSLDETDHHASLQFHTQEALHAGASLSLPQHDVPDAHTAVLFLAVEKLLCSIHTLPRFRLLVELETPQTVALLDSRRRAHRYSADELERRAAASDGAVEELPQLSEWKNMPLLSAGLRTPPPADEAHCGLYLSKREQVVRENAALTLPQELGAGMGLGAVMRLPLFCAGGVVLSSVTTLQLVADFFEPAASAVVDELLSPAPEAGESRLIAEALPREFDNKTFGALCEELAGPAYRGALAVGLLRCRKSRHRPAGRSWSAAEALAGGGGGGGGGAAAAPHLGPGSPLDFVHMLPAFDTVLTSDDALGEDLVFLLAPGPVWFGENAAVKGKVPAASLLGSLYSSSPPVKVMVAELVRKRKAALRARPLHAPAAETPAEAAARGPPAALKKAPSGGGGAPAAGVGAAPLSAKSPTPVPDLGGGTRRPGTAPETANGCPLTSIPFTDGGGEEDVAEVCGAAAAAASALPGVAEPDPGERAPPLSPVPLPAQQQQQQQQRGFAWPEAPAHPAPPPAGACPLPAKHLPAGELLLSPEAAASSPSPLAPEPAPDAAPAPGASPWKQPLPAPGATPWKQAGGRSALLATPWSGLSSPPEGGSGEPPLEKKPPVPRLARLGARLVAPADAGRSPLAEPLAARAAPQRAAGATSSARVASKEEAMGLLARALGGAGRE
jgi:hypothetical protein